MFFGSPNSGQTSAVIYSLVETCRKLDVNPSEYLEELFDALPPMQQSDAAFWAPPAGSHPATKQHSRYRRGDRKDAYA
ncbi:MAG: transposase domain-containing protein [Pontiellaceae bacterium]|nr:transposase domain-containing protein [Pontiellaceae bacterium]MBN2783931.1 transposase domain-containing protein [Pontiellaceae bacterium]